MKYMIVACTLLTSSAAFAQGMPNLPTPGTTGAFSNPAQGAPPPPTKKIPSGECITPTARNYENVRNFVPFASPEDCLKSGGRPAKAELPMRPPAK